MPVHKKRYPLFALPSKKYLMHVRFSNVAKNYHMMSYEYLNGEHPTLTSVYKMVHFVGKREALKIVITDKHIFKLTFKIASIFS